MSRRVRLRQIVETPLVQPCSAAQRAVVHLNATVDGGLQRDTAEWTVHAFSERNPWAMNPTRFYSRYNLRACSGSSNLYWRLRDLGQKIHPSQLMREQSIEGEPRMPACGRKRGCRNQTSL